MKSNSQCTVWVLFYMCMAFCSILFLFIFLNWCCSLKNVFTVDNIQHVLNFILLKKIIKISVLLIFKIIICSNSINKERKFWIWKNKEKMFLFCSCIPVKSYCNQRKFSDQINDGLEIIKHLYHNNIKYSILSHKLPI